MTDPKLLKAIRQLVEARDRAQAAGDDIGSADAEAFLREETGGKFGLADARKVLGGIDASISGRNLGRSFVQGAAMNFGDEILGLFDEGEAEDMRLREALFRRAHPIADAAGGVVGGAATALVPGLGAARAGTSIARAVGVGALAGAATGAAAGFGAGEDMSDRINRGVAGGVAGGVLGGVIPGVVGGAKTLFSPTARAARRLDRAIERSGGADAVRREVAAFRDAGRGQEVMLGDVTPRLQRELDFVANNSEDAYSDLAERVYRRQEGASQRLLDDVRDLRGGEADGPARLTQLREERSRWAQSDAGYEGLRQRNPQLDAQEIAGRLESYLDQPYVDAKWREAQRIGYVGEKPNLRTQLSFQTLQNMKEQLDDAVNRAFRDGSGDLGTRLKEVRERVVETMRDMVPGYQDVAAEYGRRVGLESAVEGGMEAWLRDDTRQLASLVSSLPPTALQEFRLGMASQLIKTLRNAATNKGEAERIVNGSPVMQDKLRVIFGNETTFRRFMERARREAQLGRSRAALGGSATHRRGQSADFDPAELVMPAVAGPGAWPGAAAGMGARAMRGALGRRTAAELAPSLMIQGADQIDDFLAQRVLRNPLLPTRGVLGMAAAPSSLLDSF